MRRGPFGHPIPAAFVAALLLGAAPSRAAGQSAPDPDLVEWGSFLASSCASCHQIGPGFRTGNFSGIPSILGLERDIFVERMRALAAGADGDINTVSHQASEDEIAAIAAYLATVGSDE